MSNMPNLLGKIVKLIENCNIGTNIQKSSVIYDLVVCTTAVL